MVNVLRVDNLPSSYEVYLYSDVHVGAKSFHEEAFREMLREIRSKKHAYAVCLGDLVEGQTTDHPHYDHESVAHAPEEDLHKPHGQYVRFTRIIQEERVAKRHLGILKGNHDWRHDATMPFVRDLVCPALGVPYLGPRAHLSLNGEVNFYLSHKGKRLPGGAKDPRQRRANREAALKRYLEPFWGSAHVMAHGDTHELLVAKPVPDPAFLLADRKGKHRMRIVPWISRGSTTDDGFVYTDPESRLYAVTGTFRRSGLVQDVTGNLGEGSWDDYAEKFGYPPGPVGYVRVVVRNDRVVDGVEVVC